MTPSLEALGIDRLTIDERIALVQAIWESIAADMDEKPLADAAKWELDRRLATHDDHPADVVPWETVRDEAIARHKR